MTNIEHLNVSSLVPHDGAMCLIEDVLRYDPEVISCRASFHIGSHPLERNGVLPSAVTIEYAAQACAIHGALLEKKGHSKPGYLAKIKSTELSVGVLKQAHAPLTIHARRIGSTTQGCLYSFQVQGPQCSLATGTLIIIFK